MSPQALEAHNRRFCCYRCVDDHRPLFRQTCEKTQRHDSHWNCECGP